MKRIVIFELLRMGLICHVLGLSLGVKAEGTEQALQNQNAKDHSMGSVTLKALRRAISEAIAKNFSGAQIDLGAEITWVRGGPLESFQSVLYFGDDARGNAHFLLQPDPSHPDVSGSSEGWVSFSAWMPARIAQKRIHPGMKLDSTWFTDSRVNVAVGPARDYRGILVSQNILLDQLESTQTVLEGQYLVTTSVRKLPDVRRGDRVLIQLVSSNVVVSTPGVAEEPGYTDSPLRVTATRSRKQFAGLLKADGVIEVKL